MSWRYSSIGDVSRWSVDSDTQKETAWNINWTSPLSGSWLVENYLMYLVTSRSGAATFGELEIIIITLFTKSVQKRETWDVCFKRLYLQWQKLKYTKLTAACRVTCLMFFLFLFPPNAERRKTISKWIFDDNRVVLKRNSSGVSHLLSQTIFVSVSACPARVHRHAVTSRGRSQGHGGRGINRRVSKHPLGGSAASHRSRSKVSVVTDAMSGHFCPAHKSAFFTWKGEVPLVLWRWRRLTESDAPWTPRLPIRSQRDDVGGETEINLNGDFWLSGDSMKL